MELGLTQQGLADRLGIHRVTLADFERGAAPVPLLVSELLRCWFRERGQKTSGPAAREGRRKRRA